jgi:hypothetical protein
MDSQRFVKPTFPDFRPSVNSGSLSHAQKKLERVDKRTSPVEDNRYPGYASNMADARLVTDYKSNCEKNVVSPSQGNPFRSWLQHHADGIIQLSRHRQAEMTGAYYYNAHTTVPPKQLQKCDEFDCLFTNTGVSFGVGLNREEETPYLFGTFAKVSKDPPVKRTPVTEVFEGGRNTPHGREFQPLGVGSFNRRDSKYGSSD